MDGRLVFRMWKEIKILQTTLGAQWYILWSVDLSRSPHGVVQKLCGQDEVGKCSKNAHFSPHLEEKMST